MSRIRAAVAGIAGNYALTVLATVEGLIITPLCLKYVDRQLYGLWLATGDMLAWLSVLDLGLGSIIVQRVASAHAREDPASVRTDAIGGMLALVCMAVLLLSGGLAGSILISHILSAGPSVAPTLQRCFLLASISVALSILSNGLAGIATALQRVGPVMIFMSVAAIIGPVATILLLTRGYGLAAVPVGLIARNGLLCLANLVHAAYLYTTVGSGRPRAISPTLRWYAATASTVFLSKLSGVVLGRCDAILVGVLLGPEATTAMVLTRRGADILRMLLDRVTGALYAPFSHLVGEGIPARIRQIARAACIGSLTASVVGSSTYIAFNCTFLRLWLGTGRYGDQMLTVLFAIATVSAILNNLLLYLYSATGELKDCSWLAVLEIPLRAVSLIVLVSTMGIYGAPLATTISSNVISVFLSARLRRKINHGSGLFTLTAHQRSAYLVIVGMGLAAAALARNARPAGALAIAIAFTTLAAVCTWMSSAELFRSVAPDLLAAYKRQSAA